MNKDGVFQGSDEIDDKVNGTASDAVIEHDSASSVNGKLQIDSRVDVVQLTADSLLVTVGAC